MTLLEVKTKLLSGWTLGSSLMAFALVVPIFAVIAVGLGSESQALAHLKQTVLTGYIQNTLMLVGCVGLLVLILGVLSAYIVTFYTFRGVRICAVLLVLPFVIPSYILGYIYSDLLGYYGPLHRFLLGMGIEQYFDVLNFSSVVVVLGLSLYAYVYLLTKVAFNRNSSALLNPALSLGASRLKVFFRIVLPLARPSIVAGLMLVVMECVSDFGTVKYYGVDTLTTGIFKAWFDLDDIGSASYMASLAMLIILAFMLIETLSRGKKQYKTDSISRDIKQTKPSRWGVVIIWIFLSIPIGFGFLIPCAWLIWYAVLNFSQVADYEFWFVLFNSFLVGAISAMGIVGIALILGYSARLFEGYYMQVITKIATLGYAVPGAVIAVGVLVVSVKLDEVLIGFGASQLVLTGSFFALCLSYAVRFLAVGISGIESSFQKSGIGVNKAARSLRCSKWQTLLRVDLPLIKGGVFSAFILVFVDILKELPLTLILRPFNYDTLATKTYELAGIEFVQESSVYAIGIVALCIFPVVYALKNYK